MGGKSVPAFEGGLVAVAAADAALASGFFGFFGFFAIGGRGRVGSRPIGGELVGFHPSGDCAGDSAVILEAFRLGVCDSDFVPCFVGSGAVVLIAGGELGLVNALFISGIDSEAHEVVSGDLVPCLGVDERQDAILVESAAAIGERNPIVVCPESAVFADGHLRDAHEAVSGSGFDDGEDFDGLLF